MVSDDDHASDRYEDEASVTTAQTIDVQSIAPIGRDEAAVLATTEYERLLDLLREFDTQDWSRPTDCTEWNVRDLVAHLLGAAEAGASLLENTRQLVRGAIATRRRGGLLIDRINDIQVADRAGLGPTELVRRLEDVAPRTVRGRHRPPAVVRTLPAPDGIGGRTTLGFVLDVLYTRDIWMHRIDLARATGREILLTPDHDGRLIEDVVAHWASVHGRAFTLVLHGPAGGTYVTGNGGQRIEVDAIDFCRSISGRRDGEDLLATPVPF